MIEMKEVLLNNRINHSKNIPKNRSLHSNNSSSSYKNHSTDLIFLFFKRISLSTKRNLSLSELDPKTILNNYAD